MIILDVLCICMPYIAAFFIVRWAFRPLNQDVYPRSLSLVLVLAIGMGIGSCSFFVWRSLNWTLTSLKLGEALFFLLCAAIFAVFARNTLEKRTDPPFKDNGNATRSFLFLRLGFFVVLGAALVGFFLLSYNRPHGVSDAFAIWNVHARFLSRGGADWTNIFSPLLERSHPDYPLLLPATIARFWTYLGTENVLVPALVGGFFTFGSVALLMFSLSALRLRNQGFVAAMFLLGSSPFIGHGSFQIADVPVGFFMLSTAVLLTLKDDVLSGNNRLLVLAGIACGLAAWTKNEGILFVGAVLVSRMALYLTGRSSALRVRELLFFACGFFPVIAILLFFKMKYSPPNDLMAAQSFTLMIPKLFDLSRYALIGRWFFKEITHFGNGVTILFLLYVALAGVKLNKDKVQTLISLGTLLATMLCGHFLIYVISPHDLNWHLPSSLQRLLIQLWPTLLFLTFLITGPLFDPESKSNGDSQSAQHASTAS